MVLPSLPTWVTKHFSYRQDTSFHDSADCPEYLPDEDEDDEDEESEHPQAYADRRRVVFTRTHTVVRGWPKGGGTWYKTCDGVDLDFLGLNRFREVDRADDDDEEEKFCNRLRSLGACYGPRSVTIRSEISSSYWRNGESPQTDVWIGWSKRGVWTLVLEWPEAESKGTGMIYNARNMQERCALIQRYGGRIYRNPEECKEIKGRKSDLLTQEEWEDFLKQH